ncbi:synaptotagmin-like protein 4 [Pollicipes pollicipes]|uniref:synaptotagmin-like protein 4 n=1 Tax=Pollicipes pollicipes TaxID=41117 RepID=UPI00188579AF|nr:synaptotagmin-like protein 4 [Pollicipes pollicipes]
MTVSPTEDRSPAGCQPGDSPRPVRSPAGPERRSQTSLAASEPDDDIDQLVAQHRRRSSSTQPSALGSRSDSLGSVQSTGEARYGTVTVRGDIELAVRHRSGQHELELGVHRCRQLAAADTRRNKSDPYVKVYLLPDRSKSGKRKTKTKKHTLNPVFDETLKFAVPSSELESRTLWITVWHSDMFGRNDFLGELLLPLSDQSLEAAGARWYPLQQRSELHEEGTDRHGDVVVAFKYAPPDEPAAKRGPPARGTLHVMVKEAKQLAAVRSNGSADPFCKCYLLPAGKGGKQRTSVARRTTSPRWRGSLLFGDVSAAELRERSLELAVWDHSLTSSELLGVARFNTGSGQYQGQPADWMDALGQEASLWEQMLERPGFWVEGSVPLRAPTERAAAADK